MRINITALESSYANMRREKWIDWAKSIAIFCVILTHTIDNSCSIWLQQFSSFMAFHVPLFFFVSGYLFRIKERKFFLFLKNSVKILIIPYIAFNLLSAPILFQLQSHDVWVRGFIEFIHCKGHAWAGPAWFLIALFNIRIASYWLLKINRSVACSAVVVAAILPFFLSYQLWFGVSSAMIGLPLFMSGFIMKKYKIVEAYSHLSTLAKCAVPFVLLAFVLLTRHSCSMNIGKGFISSPLSYAIMLLTIIMGLSFCYLLKGISLYIVEIISRGCIVIMGLHITIIQCLWAVKGWLPEYLHFTCEPPFIAITTFILSIVTAFFMMRYTPFLIGNRK